LEEAKVSLQDLKPCQAKLREGEHEFTAGAALWGQGNVENAVRSWAAGLNSMSQAVGACGLSQKLGWIQQEANVLGLANHTFLDGLTQVIVHGSDFYENLYTTLVAIQNGDYRSAGASMTTVLNDLSLWTSAHLCTSEVCYVVNGVMQYFSDLEGDIRTCGNDLSEAWVDFGSAFQHFSGRQSLFSRFSKDTFNVKQGMADLGKGFDVVAKTVQDCHLAELAAVLGGLAAKFTATPEFTWLQSFLKIVIDGVEVEKEIAAALTAFGRQNWPGFAYNVVKLVKTFTLSKNQMKIAAPTNSSNVSLYM